MSRIIPSVPLPLPLGGINALPTEARPDQFAEGLNVYDDGEALGRRPYAFKGIVAAGPFFYPPSRTTVALGPTPTIDTDRAFNTLGTQPFVMYVGVDEVFDGFHIPISQSTLAWDALDENIVFELHYWNGTAWTAVPWFLDSTKIYSDDQSPDIISTCFGKWGYVHWRRGQLTGWAASTLASTSRYWIRVRMVLKNTPGTAVDSRIDISVLRPGIQAFRRAPINGMFYIRMGDRSEVMIASDRVPARGLEKGGMLCRWTPGHQCAEKLSVVRYSGAGYWGNTTMPVAYEISGGSPSTAMTGTTGLYDTGTNAAELVTPPVIRTGRPVQDIVPQAPFSTADVRSATLTLNAFASEDFEHFIIRCTARSGAGPALNEQRIISRFTVSGGVAIVEVSSAWGATPDANNRFEIIEPMERVLVEEALIPDTDLPQEGTRELDFPISPASDGQTAQITLQSTADHADLLQWLDEDAVVHFRRQFDSRWTIPGGRHWRGSVDPITREVVVLNGGRPYTFDGVTLRKLEADYTSDSALGFIGRQSDVESETADPSRLDPKAALRIEPPGGECLAHFAGRIFIAQGKRVYWSMAYGANNIWPYSNEQDVRDQYGDDIVALIPYGDRLIVVTPTALHAMVPAPGEGYSLQPITQGLGFVSQEACDYVRVGEQVAIIGATRDGIYSSGGGQLSPVVGNWEGLEPGGVNQAKLHRSVACAWNTQETFLFAYPSKSSDINDRLALIDIRKKRIFVWSHPDGITALAVIPTSDGKEAVLVGTEEGIVETLVYGDTDDGREIEGYFRTHPASQGARHFIVYRINLTADALGQGQTLTLRAFRDRQKSPAYSADFPFDLGLATYGIAQYGLSEWAEGQTKTISCGVKSSIKAGELAFEVRSTARWRLRAWSLEMRALTTGRK